MYTDLKLAQQFVCLHTHILLIGKILKELLHQRGSFEEDTGHHLSHWLPSKHFALKPSKHILSWSWQEAGMYWGETCWLKAGPAGWNGQSCNIWICRNLKTSYHPFHKQGKDFGSAIALKESSVSVCERLRIAWCTFWRRLVTHICEQRLRQ